MESNSLSPGPILVASDFSDAADEAVRQAHLWATRADCELSALHVMAGAFPMHPLFPQLHEQDATAAVVLERQLAERLSERINRCTGRDLDTSRATISYILA